MTRAHFRSYTPPDERAAIEGIAESQEAEIRALFTFMSEETLSPWEVQELLLTKYAITSIRRAMTNLTSCGFLEKIEHIRKPGPYGATSCVWRKRRGDLTLFDQVA